LVELSVSDIRVMIKTQFSEVLGLIGEY